jgi:hypothetical protein
MQKNTKIGDPPRFSHNPKYPPKKNLPVLTGIDIQLYLKDKLNVRKQLYRNKIFSFTNKTHLTNVVVCFNAGVPNLFVLRTTKRALKISWTTR